MNYLSVVLFLCFGLNQISSAQSVDYPIDDAHSVISFSVGFAGGVTGGKAAQPPHQLSPLAYLYYRLDSSSHGLAHLYFITEVRL